MAPARWPDQAAVPPPSYQRTLASALHLDALAALICQIWGIIAGFSGTVVVFPLVGSLAERLVGGRPIPLY